MPTSQSLYQLSCNPKSWKIFYSESSGPEKGTEMSLPNRYTPAPQVDRAAVFPLSHSSFLLGFLPSCPRDGHCPTRLEGCSFSTTAAENSLAVFFYKSLTALHTVVWAALFKAHCDCFSSFPWLCAGSRGDQPHNITLEEKTLSCWFICQLLKYTQMPSCPTPTLKVCLEAQNTEEDWPIYFFLPFD